MVSNRDSNIPPGWVGGFAESNPDFAYPNPNLSSLPLLDNMDNIDRLKRQQSVKWPEFSWESVPDDPSSRCFQRFAHNISRLGYDDTGRVWSIICPQQGVVAEGIGALNVEVTVTGQRGWADESNKELAAGLTVEGIIWLSPSAHQNILVKEAWDLFAAKKLPFPSDKANAIKVKTYAVGGTDPTLPVRIGESSRFKSPEFAKHESEAWTVGNVEVEIGPIEKTNHEAVDTFNQSIMNIFNQASGNLLLPKNILTWNLWFTPPALVDQEEWRTHAERWRHSIDVDHGKSPDGSVSSRARLADGTVFKPKASVYEELVDVLKIIRSLL